MSETTTETAAVESAPTPKAVAEATQAWMASLNAVDRYEADAVAEYLRNIRTFWQEPVVDTWLAAIAAGKRPELNRFAR